MPVAVFAQALPERVVVDTTWTEDMVLHAPIFIADGATLTIAKGVTITFDGGTVAPPRPLGIVVADGALVAEGTVDEPIRFVPANDQSFFTLSFGNGATQEEKSSYLRYVEIDRGGLATQTQPPPVLTFLFPRAYAREMIQNYGAVHVVSGNVRIENSTFTKSLYAAVYYDSGIVRVVNSTFEDNTTTVFMEMADNTDSRRIFFQHNWYDQLVVDGPGATHWMPLSARKHRRIVDPVIVIPGIFGSFVSKGAWKIDPVFHTYDDLLESFVINEYDPAYVIPFAYDWHVSNGFTAQLLAQKIATIKERTGMSRVDVVAHSMGGLVARAYIESDSYGGDVDQVITLATPHYGAPRAYLLWEAGEFPTRLGIESIGDKVIKEIVAYIAQENGYASIFDYVRGVPAESVRELLPTYPYLYDAGRSDAPLLVSAAQYPQNTFLERLNDAKYVARLRAVKFVKIVGDKNHAENTVAGFNVLQHDYPDGRWTHGRPIGFETRFLTDGGIRYGTGDETVPLVSAKSDDVLADQTIVLDAEHREIVKIAIPHVIEILTGKVAKKKTFAPLIGRYMFVRVLSPVDVMVTAPDGKRIGTDPETGEIHEEVPGAFYSGNDTDTEFLTIPQPLDGVYTVTTAGTGEGPYTVETTLIAQDATTGAVAESTHIITGTARTGVQETAAFTVADGAVVDPTPPAEDIVHEESAQTITTPPAESAGDAAVKSGASQMVQNTSTQENVTRSKEEKHKKKHKKKRQRSADTQDVITQPGPQREVLEHAAVDDLMAIGAGQLSQWRVTDSSPNGRVLGAQDHVAQKPAPVRQLVCTVIFIGVGVLGSGSVVLLWYMWRKRM